MFVCIFAAAAAGDAGLCVAAVVAAALGHVKDFSSSACAACGTLRLLLQYLGFPTVGSCEHLANRAARDSSRSDGRNCFLLRLLFRVELCSSNGNDVGVFEHARS